jgi:hypothetical protein
MNRFIIVLAGTTLVFASASAYLWRQERAASEQNAVLQLRVEKLEGAQRTARAILPTPAAAPVAGAAPPDSGPPLRPARAPRPAPAVGAAAAVAGSDRKAAITFRPFFGSMRMDKLLADPEYREAMRAQERLAMSSRYPDLAEALHLQPEEAEKLMDLLTDQQVAAMGRQPTFRPDGTPDENSIREWQKQMEQQQRDNQAQIASLLGDTQFQEWKDYQNSMGARMQVKQLRDTLGSSDPLRADQVQPLVAAIAAEQLRYGAELQRNAGRAGKARSMSQSDQLSMMEQGLEQSTQYNQRMHDAAAPYLSARQQEQFDRMLNQNLEIQRITVRMVRARAEAEARGEAPTTNDGQLVIGSSLVESR